MKAVKLITGLFFVLAVLVRFADAFRPLDQASWRECDIGSIARNFVREGMDPLEPRIDWRGDGPGLAEMEFPAYPWSIAASYKLFGIDDELARLISLILSIATLAAFLLLAREFLSPPWTLIAFIFFAFNPLIFEASTSAQPEGLTILAYLAAVYFFVRWLRLVKDRDLILATAATAIALLAKATSAHIGVLFAILLWRRYGVGALRQWRVWAFGIASLAPAALWYVYAKSIWLTYGNSLGVSNEYHWIGTDFFTDPYFATGILHNEAAFVFMFFGIAVAAFGAFRAWGERATSVSLAWLASVGLFVVIASRTTADDWASYYHIFAVPPAAILFAIGGRELFSIAADHRNSEARNSHPKRWLAAALAVLALAVCMLTTFALEARAVRAALITHRTPDPAFAEARHIAPTLTRDGLILASGGNCRDKDGYALAYNASYMFYWLDRKGFSICVEDQNIDKVNSFSRRGAQYFVAQKSYLSRRAGFEQELRADFPVVDETPDLIVFDLKSSESLR